MPKKQNGGAVPSIKHKMDMLGGGMVHRSVRSYLCNLLIPHVALGTETSLTLRACLRQGFLEQQSRKRGYKNRREFVRWL